MQFDGIYHLYATDPNHFTQAILFVLKSPDDPTPVK